MKKQNTILGICLLIVLSWVCMMGCGKNYNSPPGPPPAPTEGSAGSSINDQKTTDYPKCVLIERFGCQYVWCWDQGFRKGMGGLVAADPSCRPRATVEKR